MVFRVTGYWTNHRVHRGTGVYFDIDMAIRREKLMLDEDDLYTKVAKLCGDLTSSHRHGYWTVSLTIGLENYHSRHYVQGKAMAMLIARVEHTPEWNRAVMDYIHIVDTSDTRGHPSILFRLFRQNALSIRKIGDLYDVSALHSSVTAKSTLYAGLRALSKLLHAHPTWQNTVNRWIKDRREHVLADKKDQLSKSLLWQWLEQIGPLEVAKTHISKSVSYSASVWDISRECVGRTATGDSRAEALRKLGDEVAVHYRYQWASIIKEYYQEQQRRQSLSDGLVVQDNDSV